MFFLSNRDNKTEVFDKKFEFFRVSVENRHLRFGGKNKTKQEKSYKRAFSERLAWQKKMFN